MNDAISIAVKIDIKSALERLTESVVKDMAYASLIAGGLLIQNAAKQKAPWRTGTLRRSIHIGGATHLAPDFAGGEEYDDIGETGDGWSIKVGTNLVYARIQEYGGVIHAKDAPYLVFKTKDGSWHSVKSVTIPARPYLRPAFDENREVVLREVAETFGALLAQRAAL